MKTRMKRFLGISDKADRTEWWSISFISDLIVQLSALFGFIMIVGTEESVQLTCGILLVAISVIFLWVSLAVTFRRLRDRGRPMWFISLYLIPFVGWLWMLIECGFLPSAYAGSKRILVRKTFVQDGRDAKKSSSLYSNTDH
jgi:uncharacterized membrane protein YhaH (DUF805 family)